MLAEMKALVLGNSTVWGGLSEKAIQLHGWLVSSYGMTVALAVYLTAGALAVLALWRMVKFSFDVVRCVAIPSAAVALVGAWLSPLSFYHILPMAAAVFAGLMLLRG